MYHRLLALRDALWGWPLLGFILFVGVVVTYALRFLQIRLFVRGWASIFQEDDGPKSADLTPFQAFLNTLSVSMGNGSLAGVATAIYAGGPGAVFWMFVFGFIGMILRFAEVFLAVSFSSIGSLNRLGGPFSYIQKMPCGSFLVYIYALSCLFYGFSSGNAMQCNSISTALVDMTGAPSWIVALGLVLFVAYTLLGGVRRTVAISQAIVPWKVGLFFTSIIGVLFYYRHDLLQSLFLIMQETLSPSALRGGIVGVTIQQVLRLSLARSINSNEAGLGTVGIFYGNTGSVSPIRDGLSSMISTFISNNVVAGMISLALIASGMWNTGSNGNVMVVRTYASVYGHFGGWIVALLSISFGMGVFIAYGYVTRQCWLFLTNGRFEYLFIALFCAISGLGAIMSIQAVWALVDIAVGCCLIINLIAILYYLPYIRKHVLDT